jgi:predicted ATPase
VIAQLERGLDTIPQLPESEAKSEDELELLMLLGPCLIATRGYAAEDVEHTYNRAQQLYERLKRESYRFPVLWNFAGFRMARAELDRSGPLVHQLVELANASGQEELVLMAHSALGQQLFFEGSFEPANLQFDQVISRYDIEQHGALADVYSQEDPGIMCTSMDALALWFLGFPEEATARMESALEVAEKLSNPHSSALSLLFNGWLCQLRRDAKAAQENAENLIEICTQHSIYWLSFGRMLRGWAIAQQTAEPGGLELVRHNLDEWRASGSELGVPYCLGLLSETYRALGQIDAAQSSVEEALLLVNRNNERWIESELHRLQGGLVLESDNGDQELAADCFARSLRVAREQQARSLELRAALSLSRLRLQQGRSREARDLLEPISAWFPARGGTEVRVRTVSVQAGQPVSLDTRPNFTEIRPDDGAIRWLIVEAATSSELEELFNRLDCDGKEIADHIAGEQWTHWLDRKQFCIMGLAEPTAWSPAQSLACIVPKLPLRMPSFSVGGSIARDRARPWKPYCCI